MCAPEGAEAREVGPVHLTCTGRNLEALAQRPHRVTRTSHAYGRRGAPYRFFRSTDRYRVFAVESRWSRLSAMRFGPNAEPRFALENGLSTPRYYSTLSESCRRATARPPLTLQRTHWPSGVSMVVTPSETKVTMNWPQVTVSSGTVIDKGISRWV